MKTNLTDTNFNCLITTVVSYKNLWEDVLEKGLTRINENEEVINIKTGELKKYLENKGVKFSNNNDYTAEFEC